MTSQAQSEPAGSLKVLEARHTRMREDMHRAGPR